MPRATAAPSSVTTEFPLLLRAFETLSDSRKARGKVHPLPGVLALVVVGLMAGHRSLVEIARWAAWQPEPVLAALGLRRPPSVATLWRLLQLVRITEVREALLSFACDIRRLRHRSTVETVALDGKTLRGSWEGAGQLHVLNAFATDSMLALDQVKVENHLLEARAAEIWIAAVAGRFPAFQVFTGDAGYADQTLCAAMVAAQRDYVVKVKKTSRNCSRTS